MLSVFALLVAASAATADIRPILLEQGFDSPLNGRETITYSGHIRQGRNDYHVYTYAGVHRAAAVDHGVNRIIVILNGSTYLGSYHVGWPTKCEVRGELVICDAKSPGRVIQFTDRGPPRQIWFDGEILQMEFGRWFKSR